MWVLLSFGALVIAGVAFVLWLRRPRRVLRPPATPSVIVREEEPLASVVAKVTRHMRASGQAISLNQVVSEIEDALGWELTEQERAEVRDELFDSTAAMPANLERRQAREDDRNRRTIEEELRISPQIGDEPDRNVQFHALWPSVVREDEWTTLYVYLCAGAHGIQQVYLDFARRAYLPVDQYAAGGASAALRRGAVVTIVPRLPGATFNPPLATIAWIEDWHCVELRMRVDRDPDLGPGTRSGAIAFYVGPVAIADIAFNVVVGDRNIEVDDEMRIEGARPYRAIFVSYAHEDTPIVEGLEHAYQALGDSYLRDVNILRSGQQWNTAILGHIPTADVFQLCWSAAAQRSRYVEQEWRYANGLQRPHFIRPVYWERPMPPPPAELADLHFAFVPLQA